MSGILFFLLSNIVVVPAQTCFYEGFSVIRFMNHYTINPIEVITAI